MENPAVTRQNPEAARIRTKVFIVMQRLYAARDGQPNAKPIAVRLTRREADDLVKELPGTYIERFIACKF